MFIKRRAAAITTCRQRASILFDAGLCSETSGSSSLTAGCIYLIGAILPLSVPECGSVSKFTIYFYYGLGIEGKWGD